MDVMNQLPSRDYDYETLSFIADMYDKNLSGGKENTFREKLFDLFEGEGLNTKTKKSDLYKRLENELKEIIYLVRDVPREIIATNWIFRGLSGEQPNEEDHQKVEKTAMLSGVIQGAIKIKLIARYETLLPKRRTTQFKESYPLLESCFNMYQQYDFNKESSEIYMAIHNNNGISEQVQNLHLCKDEIKQDSYGNIEVKLQTTRGSIKLDVDTKDGVNPFDIANQVTDYVGATQSQLIVYIMSLVFEQNKPEDVKKGCNINIDVREYCKLKEIEFDSRVGDSIYQDIKNLEKIIIEYEYINDKGKKDHLRQSPLVLNTGILDSYSKDGKTLEKQVVGVALGKWIETLSYSQFQYISKAFFQYKLRNNKGTIIPISYYINCQHRNNLKKSNTGANEFKIKVNRLTSKLGISEDTIKNQGYKKKLKSSLEKTLFEIQKSEKFEWSYKNGNHASRIEFEEDVIIFKNIDLDRQYRSKGYENKRKAK